MRSERGTPPGPVRRDTGKTSAGSVVEPFGGHEEKQTHFSYKAITLTACRAQIRIGGGKDGSRETNYRLLQNTACRLHSPRQTFPREIKEVLQIKTSKMGNDGRCVRDVPRA